MTHAELETRIGETKTLREWIAELDLRPTTLNAETTDETYAYVVCTEDRTYQEYIVASDYRGRSLTAESEEMYLDAEFELDGMGGYSLEETVASFSARHEKARALRKAIIRAKFELARLAGLSDEYNEADGDTFECVIDRAAEFFGVTVIATVAEALKSLRKRTGLSQTAFGDICGGIPLRTIQNWESGIRECPDYVLFLIKSHLKSENLI